VKVGSASDVRVSSGSKGAGRAGPAFSLGQTGAASETQKAAPTAGVTGVSSIDALLALQAVGGPLERKRKAVGRAGRILDVLDEVKIALLDGEIAPDSLNRLLGAIQDQREATEDPGLESVLDEIETRAAVELAKLERLRPAA
jgi:hypothetical protein